MLKIKNIKPLFNGIVTTCNVYKEDKTENGIITKTAGSIKEYQTVESIGNTVSAIKVGDIVMINPKRYIVPEHKDKKDNSIKGVIGDELSLKVNMPIIEYGGNKHLLLYDQDVEYIIEGEEIEDSIILPKNKIIC